jgi:hypothetical protein
VTANNGRGGAAPGAEQTLIIEWPARAEKPTTFYLSNLPPKTPKQRLVYLAKVRWRIEQDYQEMKGELGLDHFEGRSWRGFHHHVTAAADFSDTRRSSQTPSEARRPTESYREYDAGRPTKLQPGFGRASGSMESVAAVRALCAPCDVARRVGASPSSCRPSRVSGPSPSSCRPSRKSTGGVLGGPWRLLAFSMPEFEMPRMSLRGHDIRRRESLMALGLTESVEPCDAACAWCLDGVRVDVMPANAGFTNRW